MCLSVSRRIVTVPAPAGSLPNAYFENAMPTAETLCRWQKRYADGKDSSVPSLAVALSVGLEWRCENRHAAGQGLIRDAMSDYRLGHRMFVFSPFRLRR